MATHGGAPQGGADFSDLIPGLRAGLVGREGQLAEAVAWVRDHRDAGGLLWIGGKPGIGKSAFMAELAQRAEAWDGWRVLAYFFRQGDARCSPDAFYESAVAWLTRAMGMEGQAGDAKEAGRIRLARLLASLDEAGPVLGKPALLLLLDGLDEVADADAELARLPAQAVTPGLVWVCSGRDHPRLREMREAGAQLWERGELPPLTAENVRQLLARDALPEAFISAVAERSEGLPLYVRLVLADVEAGRLGHDEPERLPAGLGPYYDALLARLPASLLGVLCWALEPLDDATLAQILDASDTAAVTAQRQQAETVLRSAVTPEGECGYMLYHLAFREHLLTSASLASAREEGERRLLDWCARWRQQQYPYALRRYADHLAAASRVEELYGLARDAAYEEAQAARLPSDPAAPLRTARAAIRAAMASDDAPAMAEFCLLHARRARGLGDESPLQASRRGNVERAWRLAELTDPEHAALWHLLVAHQLHADGRPAEASDTLARVLDMSVPRLSFDNFRYANALLVKLLPLDEELCYQLQARLLEGSGQGWLFQDLIKLGRVPLAARVAASITDPMWCARCLKDLAKIRYEAGDKEASRAHLRAAIEACRRIDERPWQEEIEQDLVEELADVGDFDGAELALSEIGDHEREARALAALAKGLLKAGRVDVAVAAARRSRVPWRQAWLLADLGRRLAEAGEAERVGALANEAQEIAEALDGWPRARVLGAVAAARHALGDPGADAAFAAAIALARELASSSDRDAALGGIVASLAQSGRLDDALALADELHDARIARHNAMAEVIRRHLDAGEFDAALGIVRRQEPGDRMYTLRWVSQRAAEAGYADLAAALAREATGLAKELVGVEEYALPNMVKILAEDGRFDDAMELARQIPNEGSMADYHRRHAWYDVAVAMIEADLGDRARTQVERNLREARREERDRGEERWRSEGREHLVWVLASRGHDALAAEVAAEIADPQDRARAWLYIGEARAGAGSPAAGDALKTASEAGMQIEDEGNRFYALKLIASAQAQACRVEASRETFALAFDIVRNYERSYGNADEMQARFFGELAEAQAEVGDVAGAEATIAAIEYPWGRVLAQRMVASTQAAAGEPEHAAARLADAARAAEAIPDPAAGAELLAGVSEAYASMGRPEEAATALRAAFARAEDAERRWRSRWPDGPQGRVREPAEYNQDAWLIGRAWAAVGTLQAASGDVSAALASVQRIPDKTAGFVCHAIGRVAAALATGGHTDAALEVTREIELFHREDVLQSIAAAQIKAKAYQDLERTLAAMAECLQGAEQQTRDRFLEAIAWVQAKAGMGADAVQTAERILAGRDHRLPSIARAAAGRGDRETFKQLLSACAYSLEAMYHVIGFLAQVYPDHAPAVTVALRASG